MSARHAGVGPLTEAEAWFAEAFMDVRFDLAEVRRQYESVEVPGLVVGMAPGPRTSSSLPMFPHPAGSAGGRLLAMSDMPAEAYLGRLRRANLCDGAFRVSEARERARDLYREHRTAQSPHPRFVVCGRQVTGVFRDVFGVRDHESLLWFQRVEWAGIELVAVPHPSGRCREYNDPAVRERAGEAVRWAARWGET